VNAQKEQNALRVMGEGSNVKNSGGGSSVERQKSPQNCGKKVLKKVFAKGAGSDLRELVGGTCRVVTGKKKNSAKTG